MKKLFLFASILCISLIANAQNVDSETPFQFTFITPLGTNGMNSHQSVNKISLNVLGGVSKANTGFEIGSLFNINLEYTKGVQLSGIINYSGNSESAVQLAGIGNFNMEQNGGVMVSGNLNVARKGSVDAQVSGILNYAENAKIQVGGIVNISTKDATNVQVAGIGSIADEAHTQISGIFNVAKNVKGVQIGLINISETNDGAAIGLINIVKKGGKYEFEVGVGDVLKNNFSFKMGTNKFYSIFSTGVNYMHDEPEYAVGFGLGSEFTLKDKWKNQIEMYGYSITDDGRFKGWKKNDDWNNNQLYQIKYTVSKELNPHFKIFAGPTLNVMVSDRKLLSNGKVKSSVIPYSIWDNGNNKGKNRVDAWIGFNAGVRF